MARFSLQGDIPLKPEEYRLLRDLFSAKIGVQFGPESRFAKARGHAGPGMTTDELMALLRGDPE